MSTSPDSALVTHASSSQSSTQLNQERGTALYGERISPLPGSALETRAPLLHHRPAHRVRSHSPSKYSKQLYFYFTQYRPILKFMFVVSDSHIYGLEYIYMVQRRYYFDH